MIGKHTLARMNNGACLTVVAGDVLNPQLSGFTATLESERGTLRGDGMTIAEALRQLEARMPNATPRAPARPPESGWGSR